MNSTNKGVSKKCSLRSSVVKRRKKGAKKSSKTSEKKSSKSKHDSSPGSSQKDAQSQESKDNNSDFEFESPPSSKKIQNYLINYEAQDTPGKDQSKKSSMAQLPAEQKNNIQDYDLEPRNFNNSSLNKPAHTNIDLELDSNDIASTLQTKKNSSLGKGHS